MKRLLLFPIALFFSLYLFASNGIDPLKKQTKALRITESIKIDGNLDEEIWQRAELTKDFIQNEPNPGAAAMQPSEVRILYDNNAIYIGAKLFDSHPDSIEAQLSERDRFENTDWFGVMLDAYQDGLNGVGFLVTPKGVQFDIKYFAGSNGNGVFGGDRNWDAVWISEAKITDEGWQVELKIPYMAIRFPAVDEQIWNINFVRSVRRNRELSFWSEVDPSENGTLQQAGQISGINNIKPPVRLSATPFVAGYLDVYDDKDSDTKSTWRSSLTGGMDVKYGLNDAFTLDMTLIPDFGQVQFDNQVLNLSPFEVEFDENRQFFTEGVELFNKGNFFYSRRVGGRPIGFFDVEDQLLDGEEIVENPDISQLYNATKVSGRTNKGLGIGIFNAVSRETQATIENTETGDRRKVTTNPLTNYNVLSFDQNLPNNSFLTLINTNVLREGSFYDANVTGLVYNIRNKAQSWAFRGRSALSQKYYDGQSNDFGHTIFGRIEKISGNWQGGIGYLEESETYDINDLGLLFNNNSKIYYINAEYNWFKPFSVFRRARVGGFNQYERLYKPDKFTEYGIGLNSFLLSMDNYGMGLNLYAEPFGGKDYFEPRTPDASRFYKTLKLLNVSGFISSNYNKKFFFDIRSNWTFYEQEGRNRFNLTVEPNFRLSDKFVIGWEVTSRNHWKDEGYVDVIEFDDGQPDDIIFGRRDNIEVENLLKITYTFNNKMNLSIRLRHYWAKAAYESFHLLTEDGGLGATAYNDFNDRSFNSLNLDTVFRWRFAPGSDIFIVWKNNTTQLNNELSDVRYDYWEASQQLEEIPSLNSLSFRVIYFLDYLSLRKG